MRPTCSDRASGVLMIAGLPTVLGELHIADPNLPTRLDVVVTYPMAAPPPDQVALRAALTDMLTYLNQVNASDTVAQTRQTLSYGKLLHVTPLPNNPARCCPPTMMPWPLAQHRLCPMRPVSLRTPSALSLRWRAA